MKRYYIVGAAIAGFFVVIALIMKTVGTPVPQNTSKQGRIENALNKILSQQDQSTVAFKKAEKAPSWGMLKTAAQPKIQSFSFNGPAKPEAAKVAKKDNKSKKKKTLAKKKSKKPTLEARVIRSSPKTKNSTSDLDLSMSTAGGQVLNPDQNKKDPNALPETLEEWEQYVLNPPSMERLQDLIRYFQAKLVKDEIFYGLCEKMIASPSNQIRKFGIIALGSSPSPKSFALLNQAALNERSSSLSAFIDSNFQTYLAIQFVGFVGPALNANKDYVRIHAALMIEKSARINIQPTNEESPTRGGRSKVQVAYAKIYQGFIPLLSDVADSDPSLAVRQAAAQSLDTLKSLLGTQTVAAY